MGHFVQDYLCELTCTMKNLLIFASILLVKGDVGDSQIQDRDQHHRRWGGRSLEGPEETREDAGDSEDRDQHHRRWGGRSLVGPEETREDAGDSELQDRDQHHRRWGG